jgi:protocatechuate 3,4-dioxygenase beta subunit
MDNRERGV